MRYFGKVGFGIPTDLGDGVWSDDMIERAYKGVINNAVQSVQESDKVNDDVRLQHRIEIMADAFAQENYSRIKYVELTGSLWTVQSVEIQRPRLLLTVGGPWNGRTPA